MEKEKTPMRFFVDSSFWFAYFDRDDIHHQQARDIIERKIPCVTSTVILHETLAICARRLSFSIAIKAGEFLLNNSIISLIIPTLNEEITAWKLYREKSKGKLSWVDCTNKILMDAHGIRDTLAFDKHFETFGMRIHP